MLHKLHVGHNGNKHLFPKANSTQVFFQWKCSLSCVNGMQDKRHAHACRRVGWLRGLRGRHQSYKNEEDCPGLGNREKPGCTELAKIEKWGEVKLIRYFETMPDSQKQRSEEKLRWFGALRWPYTGQVKVEKLRETKMIQCLEVAFYQSR